MAMTLTCGLAACNQSWALRGGGLAASAIKINTGFNPGGPCWSRRHRSRHRRCRGGGNRHACGDGGGSCHRSRGRVCPACGDPASAGRPVLASAGPGQVWAGVGSVECWSGVPGVGLPGLSGFDGLSGRLGCEGLSGLPGFEGLSGFEGVSGLLFAGAAFACLGLL